MRVFTWDLESENLRRRAVQPTDAAPIEISRLLAEPSQVERVLDALVARLLEADDDCAVCIGLGGTPSPQVGTHQDDLIELFRAERDGRVRVTYARGRWQQVHFIGRLPSMDVAKGVRARLIAHGRTLAEGQRCRVESAGDGEMGLGEIVVFALVGIGPLFREGAET